MFKLLMENCIGKHGQDYKCSLCQCTLPYNDFQVIEKHVQEDRHRAIADKRAWDKIPQIKEVQRLRLLSEEEYEELVKNKIIFKIRYYYCNFCKCMLSKPDEHIKGKAHQRRYNFQKTHVENKPKVEDKKNLKPKMKENVHSLRESLSLKHHHIKFVESTNTYICEICECSLPEVSNVFGHVEEHFHKYNLAKQEVNPVTELHKIDCDIHCKKCDILLNNNETLLQCHCLFHLYKEQPNIKLDIVIFQFDHDQKVDISCLLCNVTVHDDREIAAHLDTESHLERLNLWNRCIRRNSRKAVSDASERKRVHSRELEDYIFDPTEDLEIHMKDENDENLISLEEYDKFYKCFLCKKSFDSITMLMQHCNESFIHYHKLKNFYMIYDSLDAADIQELLAISNTSNSNSSNTIEPIKASSSNLTNIPPAKSTDGSKKVHKIADKLVRKKEKKERKPKERKNPLSYNEDILGIGDKYISMCLEPGSENIYNIDQDAIHQLELGTSLTISMKPCTDGKPSKCERMCIPCGYKISPSFYYLCEHLQHEIHIQNLCDMVENSKDFEGYQDQFSDLDLAKSYMQEESDNAVKCFACEKSVPNSDDEIKNHICLPTHILKIQSLKKDTDIIDQNMLIFLKNLWYYVDKFSCKLCNVPFNREISFVKHLQEAQHLNNLQLKKEEDNKMNICFGCCSCWFGKSDYIQHYTEPLHIQASKRFATVLPQLPKMAITYLMNLDKIVDGLMRNSNEIACNQQEKEQRLLESAEETVRSLYPNVKAYAFGSRTSYLGLATSDVDVFIDCENQYFEIGSKQASQAYIQRTKNQFCKKYAHVWKKEKILLNPRVPIMKMEHKKTKLKCDISFLSGLGVEKSKLIRNYVVAYEHCRKLILFLKRWFSICDLYGPQAVNAYAISWYAIFYLQIKGILPSVKKLIEWEDQPKIVDGWQCGFLDKFTVSETNYSFKDILQGFFSYYAEFDFCTDVVCPLLGKVLKKRVFVNFDDLPEGMEIYKYRVQTEEIEFFRYDSPMCIQDPVDLTQNITKAVSKYQLRYFKSYCAQSLKML